MIVDPLEDGFLRLIEAVADLPVNALAPGADLTETGFDSLALLVSIAIVEDIAGSYMPEDLITNIRTPGDLWAFICSHAPPGSIGPRLERAVAEVHELKH